MLFVVFIAAATAIFAWRLSTSPLDLAFAKEYIEKELTEQAPAMTVGMKQLILHWPDFKGPLLLGLRGVQINSTDGKEIMAVEEAGIGFSLPHLLIGKIRPTSLILSKPEIEVIRNTDGQFEIGFDTSVFEGGEETIRDQQTTIVEHVLGYIASPGNDNVQSPLRALKSFEIKQARLDFEDRLFDTVWSIPEVSAAFRSGRNGMKATFHAELDENKDGGARILAQMDVPWETRQPEIKLVIEQFDLTYLGEKFQSLEVLKPQDVKFDVLIQGVLDQNLSPQKLALNISSASGAFGVEGYTNGNVTYSDLHIEGAYDNKAGQAALQTINVILNEIPLTGTALAQHQDNGSYKAQATMNIAALEPAQIAALWPENFKEEDAYTWLVERIADGVFANLAMELTASLDFPASENEEFKAEIDDITADFDFTGMTIDYRNPLPAIKSAAGSGWFKYNSELLHIDVEKATAGNMTVQRGTVELSHFIEGGKGHADVNVSLSGKLADVFSILEKEPIALDHGYDLSRMAGQADLNLNLGIPTYGDVSMDDVVVNLRGKATEATIPAILEETDLTGINADILVKGNELHITGKGGFTDQSLDFTYFGFLDTEGQPYKEKIDVAGPATEGIRQALGVDISFLLQGTAHANATYIDYGGRQTVDVTTNLTASTIDIEPFSYRKPSGQESKAAFQIVIEDKHIQEIANLSVSAPGLSVENGSLSFEQVNGEAELKKGSTPVARIGETQGSVDFEVLQGDVYKINANLTTLDARPFLSDKKKTEAEQKEPQTPLIVALKAQTMLTHQAHSVTNTNLYLDIDSQSRFNQLELDATAGTGTIYLRYKPDETGQRNFRFEAGDAGATLAAFGLYDKIRGGKIVIYAKPMSNISDRNLIGSAEMTNFEVVDAPTLARILSLMSLDGLANGLSSGNGLQFSRLQSNFDWLYRPQGSLIVMQEGRTSGNAVGLTFDGTVDQALGTMDISGTIAPISYLNKAIGAIPVIGEILTGGSGIFAATYSVEGETKDPQVSVNPLSVLAPGIIRKILFEQN